MRLLVILTTFWMTSAQAHEPKKEALTDADVISVLRARVAKAEAMTALQVKVLQLQQDAEYMRLTLAAQAADRLKQAAEATASAKCAAGLDMEKLTCKPKVESSK